jgi:hypothetical protein
VNKKNPRKLDSNPTFGGFLGFDDLLGLAWLGLAWLGLAWLGLAWLGLACGFAGYRSAHLLLGRLV